ncbi:Pentatricopeptide repeat-containing protein mitochondrial [Spatholobus suberectus]|nr:Pentatricopeptide repeat-containing protein mitochondrial [Spatholobus suberectus]
MKIHIKNVVSRLSLAHTWITPHVVSRSYLTETHHPNATKHEASVAHTDIHPYSLESTTFRVACHMFEEMSDLTVVSATTIIQGFVNRHCHEDAIYLFSKMLASIIRPNEFTFGTVLNSSTVLGNVVVGRQLHACAMKVGLSCHVFVGSALLDLYFKLSTIEDAQKAFRDTQHPNVVSYTTLISANMAALGIGKSFHACAIKFFGYTSQLFNTSGFSCKICSEISDLAIFCI